MTTKARGIRAEKPRETRCAAMSATRSWQCEPVDRDQYGRVVARCHARGEDLNRWMVASGWAVAYRQFSHDYVPAEEAARASRLGLWRGEFVLPSQWRKQERH